MQKRVGLSRGNKADSLSTGLYLKSHKVRTIPLHYTSPHLQSAAQRAFAIGESGTTIMHIDTFSTSEEGTNMYSLYGTAIYNKDTIVFKENYAPIYFFYFRGRNEYVRT